MVIPSLTLNSNPKLIRNIILRSLILSLVSGSKILNLVFTFMVIKQNGLLYWHIPFWILILSRFFEKMWSCRVIYKLNLNLHCSRLIEEKEIKDVSNELLIFVCRWKIVINQWEITTATKVSSKLLLLISFG